MANFGTKPWNNPVKKISILRLFEVLVVIAKKVIFSLLIEYDKAHFPGQYCLKKVRKMANFGVKPLANPFGKISIFRLIELFVFIT